MASREITEVLKRTGYEIAHKYPNHAVHNALRRRADQRGDVVLVGVGKWGLRKWYTQDELDQLVANLGGMGGRDREAHIERTKVGLQTARARGVRLGAEARINDEMKARIQQKAALKGDKKMTLGEIAKSEGIALSSIFGKFPGGRKAILKWKPKAKSEDQQSDLLEPVAGNA